MSFYKKSLSALAVSVLSLVAISCHSQSRNHTLMTPGQLRIPVIKKIKLPNSFELSKKFVAPWTCTNPYLSDFNASIAYNTETGSFDVTTTLAGKENIPAEELNFTFSESNTDIIENSRPYNETTVHSAYEFNPETSTLKYSTYNDYSSTVVYNCTK